MIVWPAKDPSAVLDYLFDWTTDLESGETIVSRVVSVVGATKQSDAIESGATGVRVWLTGGTAGTVAKVTCEITTSAARTDSEVAVLEIGGDPVGLADAKAWVKAETSDDDKVIAALVRSAVRHAEKVTGKKLTAKIVSQKLDGFPGLRLDSAHMARPGQSGPVSAAARLNFGPVSEILSVDYDDPQGVTQTLSSFRLVEGANAQLLPAYGEQWPATAIGPGTVRLSYVAGYEPTELPPELTQAVLMLVAHWYLNREAVSVGRSIAAIEIPFGVEELLADYSTPGIG